MSIDTDEDRFPLDGPVKRLYIEFSAFADLLALFFLFGVREAELFDFFSYEGDGLCGIGEGGFEACVFCFDLYDHLEVVFIDFDFMFDEEGEGDGVFGCCESEGDESQEGQGL